MQRCIYKIGRISEEEQIAFDIQDGLSRTVSERINLGFIPIKPLVADLTPYRIFENMEEYHLWQENLPEYLGYYQAR
ncbi:MAG: hypothetical protein V2A53_05485 [bacterium]